VKAAEQFSRKELVRALGLGEILIATALIVLAPVVRGETAYGAVHSLLSRTLAGEAYFLIVLAFLGGLLVIRILAAGRLAVPEPAALVLLGVYTGYVALRAGCSDHPYAAQRETLAWLANFLLFALLMVAASRRGAAPFLVAAVAGSLMVQSFQALYQYYYTLPMTRELLHTGLAGSELDLQNPAAVSRILSPEPFTTFLHANALGGWMASAALAAAGLCAGTLAGAAARSRKHKAALLCSWLLLAVLFAWAFVLTGSKGAYVAAAAALAGLLLVSPPAEGRARKVLRFLGGCAVALMLIAALAYWLFPGLPGRSGLAASMRVRLGYWRPAAVMAFENPLFGVGPGKYGAIYTQLKGPLAEESKSAHSAYMETAAEQGMVGLALLVAFWGWALWRLLRAPESRPENGPPMERADRVKRLVMVIVAGIFFTCVAAHWKLTIRPWALALMGLLWAGGCVLAAWPLAGSAPGGNGARERLVQWGISAAVAAFLIHSAADMGMSLRSLVGPALILAAIGLSAPGRRDVVLSGRRALIGAAAVLGLTLTASLLAAREWRRGETFAAVQGAGGRNSPRPDPEERSMLLAARRAALADAEEELARRGPQLEPAERDRLQARCERAMLAVRAILEEERPRLSPREKSLVLLGRMGAALRTDPNNWPLQVGRGFTNHVLANMAGGEGAERDRRLAAAEECYRQAVELAPARTRPRRDLCRFYVYWAMRAGRPEWYSRAAREYAALVKLYPLNATYIMELGDAELLAGRGESALGLYRRALSTSRQVGDEAIHLSILLENYNRLRWQRPILSALAAALDREIGRQPPSAPLLCRRALVEVARERFDEALGFMRRAVEADPGDPQLLLLLGYCHRLTGDRRKALEIFAAANTLEKKSGLTAGPGAVRRARQRTEQERKIEEQRKRSGTEDRLRE
jgi:tetratricopeptide (TPR) repeat protein